MAGKVSTISSAPVDAATLPARRRAASRAARPPTRRIGRSAARSDATAASMVLAAGRDRVGDVHLPSAAPWASPHETSAGRTKVATPDGGPTAASMVLAASRPTSALDIEVITSVEKVAATPWMSLVKGASSETWSMACSPTMLITGVRARRALWRLASALPWPGPRWRSTAAGVSATRPYPSAAPAATPSKSARMPRIAGTSSSAATKCISEVPGLAKQTSTPLFTSVSRSNRAPLAVVMMGFLSWIDQG